LKSALSHRPNFRLNELAVGDVSGSTILYLSPDLNVDHRTYPTGNESRQERTIHSIRLDDYFQPGERVDFIKLDIQGYELHALRGAARLLADNSAITLLVELWPYGLQCAGASAEELLAFLHSNRFHCSLVANGKLTECENLNLNSDDPNDYVNLFARRLS
jgi:FkbM family methyltransferase